MQSRREQESGGDLAVGAVLILVGLFVIRGSLALPRPRGWPSAPGLVPLLLGATLVVMAAVLAAGAVRAGGWSRFLAGIRTARASWGTGVDGWRPLFVLVCLALYIYVLLARLPFEVATFLYLAVVLGVLWRRGPLRVLLVSGAVAVVLMLLFEKFLRTLLPGTGSLL